MSKQEPRGLSLPRRRFVQGLTLGGVAAGLGLFRGGDVFAATGAPRAEFSGTHFELEIGEIPVDFTGRKRIATVVNGQLPAPLLQIGRAHV